LSDGVSVVGFSCKSVDRTLVGIVKEKRLAKRTPDEAVEKGESAG
jgi:hypothetical protein